MLVTLGVLAAAGQPLLQLSQPADPRLSLATRPEWYLLALFQFVKLGPPLLTSIVIPVVLVLGLFFWPLIDAKVGPYLAPRLGWRSWPVPKRNVIASAIWLAILLIIGLLTAWAVVWPQLCIPWFMNGPVCGT